MHFFCFYQIFTWHGATIELDGFSEAEYTADEVICSFFNFWLGIASAAALF